ncbi:hypothetical protein K439DRAFT_1658144 [Ramaria rubella]|nr:hypothetical protein K439DRAFT_1658144 [Ramaria rubella]
MGNPSIKHEVPVFFKVWCDLVLIYTSPCCFLQILVLVLCTCANLLLSTFLSNLICTLDTSPSFISLSSSHQMRILAIVSVLFAVTQVAFSAPVFRAFDSDVITRNLHPAQLQGRGSSDVKPENKKTFLVSTDGDSSSDSTSAGSPKEDNLLKPGKRPRKPFLHVPTDESSIDPDSGSSSPHSPQSPGTTPHHLQFALNSSPEESPTEDTFLGPTKPKLPPPEAEPKESPNIESDVIPSSPTLPQSLKESPKGRRG